ncbi:MAG: DNA/RNA non-specific endonuclease [Flavobacteriaceae bacterium]
MSQKKLIYMLLFVLVVSVLYFIEKYQVPHSSIKETSSEVVDKTDVPDTQFLPTTTTGTIVKHYYYTLSYAEDHEQAEWVAYNLTKDQLSDNDFERPYFEIDPLVLTQSADWRNYRNSGYDRGHLCPAGDRRFSHEAYNETFLTSNISPMQHDFNSGIWNRLEQKVRSWAQKYDGVFVVTGGVLKPGLQTIGDEEVSVPEAFYKIILDADDGTYKVLAFLIPNQPSSNSFYDYTVTVDEIESLTGIDFFADLPDTLETRLESRVDSKAWGKR